MLIFFTVLFVLFCKSWNVGKPLAMVGQTASKGSTTPRSAPYLICGAASPALTAGTESGQYPEQSEARSEACSAFLPLKLEHDYFHLLSLTPHKLKSHRYILTENPKGCHVDHLGSDNVAAQVWWQSACKIPSYSRTVSLFFYSDLQLIGWGPPALWKAISLPRSPLI